MYQNEYAAVLRKKHDYKSKISGEIKNQEEYEILLDEIDRIKRMRQDYEDKIKCTENVLEVHEYQNQKSVLKIELKRLLNLKSRYSNKYCSREEKIRREKQKIARKKERDAWEEKITPQIREILMDDHNLLFALRKVYDVCLHCSKKMAIIEILNKCKLNPKYNLNFLIVEICFFKNLSERSQKQVIRRIKNGETNLFGIAEQYDGEDRRIIELYNDEVKQCVKYIEEEYGFEFSYWEENSFSFSKRIPYNCSEEFREEENDRLNDLITNDKKISPYFDLVVEEDSDSFFMSSYLKFGILK